MRIVGRLDPAEAFTLQYQLVSTTMRTLPAPNEVYIRPFAPVFDADGQFTIEFIEPGPAALGELSRIRIQLFRGDVPLTERMNVRIAEAARLGPGSACPLPGVMERCPPGEHCLPNDPWAPRLGGICVPAEALSLPDQLEVYRSTYAIGFHWRGADRPGSVAALAVKFYGDLGDVVNMGDALDERFELLVPFEEVWREAGQIDATAMIRVREIPRCVEAGEQARLRCADPASPECADEVQASIDYCGRGWTPAANEVVVRPMTYDWEGGPPTRLFVAPIDFLDVGERCLADLAIGQCGGRFNVCYNSAPTELTCGAEQTECSVGLLTATLSDQVVLPGDRQEYRGDLSTAAHVGGGTCGSRTRSELYAFAAPVAGSYVFRTSSLDAGVETVLYARSHCSVPGGTRELDCTLDPDGPTASLTLQLAEGQTVYVGVAATRAEAIGAYTIEVQPQ